MIESLLLRFPEDMSHYTHIWKCHSSSNTIDSQHEAREQLCHKMIMHCAMKTSTQNQIMPCRMPGHSLHAGRRPGRIAKHSQLVLFCPVVMEIGRRSRCLQVSRQQNSCFSSHRHSQDPCQAFTKYLCSALLLRFFLSSTERQTCLFFWVVSTR